MTEALIHETLVVLCEGVVRRSVSEQIYVACMAQSVNVSCGRSGRICNTYRLPVFFMHCQAFNALEYSFEDNEISR